MGDRDNPISVRSKRRITESLLELMHDTQFSKISIKDIVEKAGLTRQTFYHNFESKEEVLIHKEGELFEDFLHYLAQHQITKWESIVLYYFRYWQRNADFLRLLIKNNLVYVLEVNVPQYYPTVRGGLNLEKTELTETEFQQVYSFCSGGIINMLVSWVQTGMVLNAQEMTDLAMKLLDGTVLRNNPEVFWFPSMLEGLDQNQN